MKKNKQKKQQQKKHIFWFPFLIRITLEWCSFIEFLQYIYLGEMLHHATDCCYIARKYVLVGKKKKVEVSSVSISKIFYQLRFLSVRVSIC